MAVKGKKTAGPSAVRDRSVDADGSWTSRNWHTMLVLGAVVLLAFLLRVVFVYGLSTDGGIFLSGGPDAAYHQRIIEYIVANGSHLVWDTLLNYPVGIVNPNPPLMDWSAAVAGMFMSLFGFSASGAAVWALSMNSAVMGALSCIPVYLIAREAFGKRAGIIAALLFGISAGAMESSVMSNGDHDAFVMFFVLWSLYFLIVALRKIRGDRFVESYGSLGGIRDGMKSYYRSNKLSLAYAVMGGFCLAAVELTWKGFTYITAIILVYFIVQVLLDRFMGRDSLATTMVVSVLLFTGLIVGLPYYLVMGLWSNWYDIPTLMAVAVLVVGLLFSFTRDRPWTLVIPTFVTVALAAVLLMWLVVPDTFSSILSGQGYFGYNKLYSTIQEAQAPSFSELATNFGWLTIWFSFFGVAYLIYRLKDNNSPAQIMVMVWVFVAIYMASSANRFIFNGAAAFAISASVGILLVLDKVDLADYFRGIRSAGLKGMWRKILRPTPLLTVLAAVFLIMMPNVLFAVDAAIPYNDKLSYDEEIYDSLPDFMKDSDYSSYLYLGSSGYTVNTESSYYWSDYWDWLSAQDADVNASERPAFLSWWDYGHEAAAYGDHPTVADNFQDGYALAATYFTAQTEAESIALLIESIMLSGDGYLSGGIRDVLTSYGLDAGTVDDMLFNGDSYVDTILSNPGVYGDYSSDLSGNNARFIVLTHYLTEELEQSELVDLYHDVREETGYDVGYVGIDYRMFPLYYGDSNIFAAIALLGDYETDSYSIPYQFYEIYAVLSTGSEVPLDEVTSSDTVTDLEYVYNDMLYDSMMWKMYCGYSPSDVGLDGQGVASVYGSLEDYTYMPCWNLSNYRVVYRTAFYNPYTDYENHTDAWEYVSYDTALEIYEKIDSGEMSGVVDMSATSMMQAGVLSVEYYDGAVINGTVTTESGEAAANVRVTVLDEYGIPHDTVLTDEDGYYEVIAPFGDVTVAYSYGDVDSIYLIGENVLSAEHYEFTYDQAMRVSDYEFTNNLTIAATAISGTVSLDDESETPLEGANVTVTDTEGNNLSTDTAADGSFEISGLMPANYTVTVTYDDHTVYSEEQELIINETTTIAVSVGTASFSGTLTDESGRAVVNCDLLLTDLGSGNVTTVTTDNDGAFSVSGLYEGDYTLETADENLTIGTQSITLSASESLRLDLVMYGAAAISGTVTYNGVNISDAQILIRSSEWQVTITSDSAGGFEAVVPVGDYSVYVKGAYDDLELVHLSMQDFSSGCSVNLSMAAANVVSGLVKLGGSAVSGAEMTFTSAAGASVVLTSSSSGYYRAALPVGNYTLYVNGGSGSYWLDVSVTSTSDRDVSLIAGYTLSGQLWYDADGDGDMGVNETLTGHTVVLSDASGHTINVLTDDNGSYSMALPGSQAYTVSVSITGFEDFEEAMTTLNSDTVQDIGMTPLNRTVSGSISGAATAITVEFVATEGSGGENATAVTAVDGSYSIGLRPGDYTIRIWQDVVSGDDSLVYAGEGSVNVTFNGDAQTVDLEMHQEVRVTVTTDDDSNIIRIEGEDSLSGDTSYELYLPLGGLSVYASNEASEKAYLDKVTVTAATATVNIVPVSGFYLSGNIYHDGGIKALDATMTVTDSVSGAEYSFGSSSGAYSVLLPAGTYDVEAEFIGLDDGMYYRYSASADSVAVSAAATRDLTYSRSLANSTVNMTVEGYQSDDGDTSILFQANDDTSMDLSVNVSGNGTAQLAPGGYTVYAYNDNLGKAYLGTVTVELSETLDLCIVLETAYELGGRTLASSNATSADVTISRGDVSLSIVSDSSGQFSRLMPAGYYDIDISASVTENGLTINYSGSFSHSLRSTFSPDYDLDRDDQASVSMNVSGPENVSVGSTYTYVLTVLNDGNTAETITLSSGDWTMTFSENDFGLNYGVTGTSRELSFTLTVPEDATVVHDDIEVIAKSADGSTLGTVVLVLNVQPREGLGLEEGDAVSSDGSSYLYAVVVNNTGNLETEYDLSINNVSLAAHGWNAVIVDSDGNEITSVTVAAYDSETVYVKLTAVVDEPSRQVSVTFTASSASDSLSESLTFTALTPDVSISPDTVDVDGPSIYGSEGDVPTLTWFLLGASVIAIMLFIMMGISRGVFSRKKK